MNSINLTPLERSGIGFDRLASLLDTALSSDLNTIGYPPYNIEMLDVSRYATRFAVAGFNKTKSIFS